MFGTGGKNSKQKGDFEDTDDKSDNLTFFNKSFN